MVASFLFKARKILLRIERRDLYKFIGSKILEERPEKVKKILTCNPILTS